MRRLCLVLNLCSALLISQSSVAQNYTVIDLGTLGGSYSQAHGINGSGQVVGVSSLTGETAYDAFRTAASSPINPATDDLGTLGGSGSEAYAINGSGQVVGYAPTAEGAYHAFRTAANSPINPATDDLGTLGGSFSIAYGINGSGQVVGESFRSDGITHAFRTAANSPINPATDDLGTLVGDCCISSAKAINTPGQVVGASDVSLVSSGQHAFRTAANSPINPATDDLGTLGGSLSIAFGINDSGQVVGVAALTGDTVGHAFRTAANSPINPATDDLGTLGGSDSAALPIDRSGQVVGTAKLTGDTASHAFLYSNAVMYDLNSLIPTNSGWVLNSAIGINDAGQIVGYGLHNGITRQFLLSPIVVTTTADLAIRVSGRPKVSSGGILTWAIAVQNKGPQAASVTIFDSWYGVPPFGWGFQVRSISNTSPTPLNCVLNPFGTGFTCQSGTVAAGSGLSIAVQGTVTAIVGGALVNTAIVSGTNVTDPNSTNNLSSTATGVTK